MFVGVDPGDRWVGVSVLQVSGIGKCRADTAVMDRNHQTFVETIRKIIPGQALAKTKEVHIITESYRQRAQGHQVWGSGDTLQLIGAIRYACEEQGIHWTEVAAGDPDKELEKLGLQQYITAWRPHMPKPGDAKWHHARSAWHCIGKYLMTTDQMLLQRLRAQHVDLRFHDNAGNNGIDFIAATMEWQL